MKHFTTVITATRDAFDFQQYKPLQSVIYMLIHSLAQDLPDICALALGRYVYAPSGLCVYIRQIPHGCVTTYTYQMTKITSDYKCIAENTAVNNCCHYNHLQLLLTLKNRFFLKYIHRILSPKGK